MDIVIISVLCILLAFTLLSLARIRGKSNQKLPPGPYPLPIIGNIHKLGKHPHRSLANLAQLYGPIMRLKLGNITTIIISSSSTAQQVLQKQDLAFSNRHVADSITACNHNKYSVVWLPVGSRWRSLRKIMSSYIFTANKLDKNQHLRTRKVHDLIRYCETCSQSGEAVDIGRSAFLTSLNLLSNTIFSKDLTDSYDNSDAKELRDLVWNIMVEAGKPNLVDFFPILKWIDPQCIKLRITAYSEKLIELFDGLVNERLELKRLGNFSQDSSATDVLHELLILQQTNEIDKTHIQHLFMDLFAAGTDTTSSIVEWGMAEILKNPDTVLAKAKAELNQVIGKGKIIGEVDICGIEPKELNMEDKFGLTLAKLHPLRAVATSVVPYGV
ncbi:Geraniol 8-hydroxylase [Heracleum sosnowskyi]|uniref:Geraniol 8-hydroxylase n=1 Tax=Heracleum sosnowskyi TaxID=360622 RepID=A0AAD8MWZ4_9APIA|nr:Geraniol 8-hydroxylase [Heracleum sosnowskyi]